MISLAPTTYFASILKYGNITQISVYWRSSVFLRFSLQEKKKSLSYASMHVIKNLKNHCFAIYLQIHGQPGISKGFFHFERVV